MGLGATTAGHGRAVTKINDEIWGALIWNSRRVNSLAREKEGNRDTRPRSHRDIYE